MAKDPAVLFYTSDFLVGTMFFTDEQTGKYIKLLCYQHQKGRLTEKDMLKICKEYDKDIFNKFLKDEDGLYYNERMDKEFAKRREYSESRRNNRLANKDMNKICKTYDKHMENININENRNEDVIEIETVFNSWNAFADMRGLTKIVKLTDKRVSNIKSRLAEKDFDFNHILQRIDESDFLLGKKTDWKIDFDFIFGSKNNWIKIMEGKYGNNTKQVGASPEQLATIVARRFEREQAGD